MLNHLGRSTRPNTVRFHTGKTHEHVYNIIGGLCHKTHSNLMIKYKLKQEIVN